jgi:polyisoprenoid-binding protein YceI
MEMTMNVLGRVVGLWVVLGSASMAMAQHQTFHINPARSEAKFYFEGANPGVAGTFKLGKSAVEFDKVGPKIGGSVILLARTESSGDSGRDEIIRKQVLDAGQFAEITFMPAGYAGTVDVSNGKSVIQVTGTLLVHGQPHTVVVPVEIHANGNQCVATLHFVVPYVAWGMTQVAGVGDKVDLDVKLVGFLTPEN